MHLDQRHISIRERGFAEILDLSLTVLRVHWWPLLLALAAGAIPFGLGNYWLLRESHFEVLWGERMVESWIWVFIVVVWEIPLATAPMTIYLGQVTFDRPADPWSVLRNLAGSGLQMILFQVVLRGILAVTMFGLLIPYIRWPYLNELILLERNPLRISGNRPATLRRNQSLHRNTLMASCCAGGSCPLLSP